MNHKAFCRAAGSMALAAFLSTSACSAIYPVRVQKTDATPGAVRTFDSVQVFDTEPSRAFIEIAYLTTESINYDNPGHAISRLRTVAAEHGADAIIIESRGRRNAAAANMPGSRVDRDFGFGPPTGGPSQAAVAGYNSASFARATAIRWVQEDDSPPFNLERARAGTGSRPSSVTTQTGARANPLRNADIPFADIGSPASQPGNK